MQRHEILEMMGQLQLAGMRAAYDEVVTAGIKRKHGVERILGALLKAQIDEKQARSIRYQMGIAKLPLGGIEIPPSSLNAIVPVSGVSSSSCRTMVPAAVSAVKPTAYIQICLFAPGAATISWLAVLAARSITADP